MHINIYKINIYKFIYIHYVHTNFYFSGLGYITGGETARITGYWQWGLRITPILGIIAIILLLTVVRDPIRGEREGGVHLTSTTWSYDVKELLKK